MKAKKETKVTYKSLQDGYISRNLKYFKSKKVADIFNAVSKGENKYLRVNREETSSFDKKWVDEIEKIIPDLEDIVTNPRRITKTVGNVVPVEMVKKINNETVRHLASHTQFVKEITDRGDVVPSKLLSIDNDDDYTIYENRFIATLIRRLVLFVEKRYEYITNAAPLKNTDELWLSSTSVVDGALVEIETKVKVTRKSEFDGVDKESAFVQRIKELRNHLRFCYTSEFMKTVKNEKDVRNPIMVTNILKKNPKYHRCYLLWRFIERYSGVGMTYSVNDKFDSFSGKEKDEANALLLASFLAARPGEIGTKPYSKNRIAKPKILKSIDDEEFEFGPYFEGPIEFVRIDDEYRKATETTNKFYRITDSYENDTEENKQRILPRQKREIEIFNSDKRLHNVEMNLMTNAKDSLMSRKRRAAAAFERQAMAIRAKLEEDERNRIADKERRAQIEKEKQVQLARKRLSSKAKEDAGISEKKDEQTSKKRKK